MDQFEKPSLARTDTLDMEYIETGRFGAMALRFGLEARAFRAQLRGLERHPVTREIMANIQPHSCKIFGSLNSGPVFAIGSKGFGRCELKLFTDLLGYQDMTPRFSRRLPTSMVARFLEEGLTITGVIEKLNVAVKTLRAQGPSEPDIYYFG